MLCCTEVVIGLVIAGGALHGPSSVMFLHTPRLFRIAADELCRYPTMAAGAARVQPIHYNTKDIMASTRGLTAEQLDTFNKNGFLIIPGALSPIEVTTLIDTTNKILNGPPFP